MMNPRFLHFRKDLECATGRVIDHPADAPHPSMSYMTADAMHYCESGRDISQRAMEDAVVLQSRRTSTSDGPASILP